MKVGMSRGAERPWGDYRGQRMHLTRFHGVLAAHSKLLRLGIEGGPVLTPAGRIRPLPLTLQLSANGA